MGWLLYFGVPTLILGLLYLLAPGVIKRLDDWGRRAFISIAQTLKYHIWLGLLFTAAGIAMIYIGFTIK